MAKKKTTHKKESPAVEKFEAVKPRTKHQAEYIEAVNQNDIVFGIGPAGTGKTFLAVAMAVEALKKRTVERIVITRPAVEAGEQLGFLPGSLQEKADPYLRPIYDALYSMMFPQTMQRLMQMQTIEIAPVAFMRGRTLTNSIVLVDEAQNTTVEQMKMILTRLGEGSRMIVNGDITQIDLKKGVKSGLVDAIDVLAGLNGIHFQYFDKTDVVRHPLVQTIVDAYENRVDD